MARRTDSAPSANRTMGIRNRLLLLLVVPLSGLLVVTGIAMFDAVGRSGDATELRGNAEVSLAADGLVDALQSERQVLAAGQPPGSEARAAVEAATSRLRAVAARQGGALEQMAVEAIDRVHATDALARTDTGGLVAVDGFSPAVDRLLTLSRAGFDPHGAIDERSAATTDLLAEAQESAARERDLVQALSARDALVPDQYGAVSELASEQSIRAAQAAADAPESFAVRIARIGDAIAAAARGRDQLFFGSADSTTTNLQDWVHAADTRVSDLQTLRDDAAARAVAAVDDLGASSRTILLLAAAALIGVLLISSYLVRSAIRSIARPLRELATQADEVAETRLPEAVRSQQAGNLDVHLPTIRASGAREVQEVAGSFNDVQDTALRLAGEQAVLRRNLADALTNLGRRNQVLLGRQLDFISSLEQRETDPAFLESLFKLDHLASRMRRNAESLLILTGTETPRRRRTPAPLSEVVRAAMSEVEDFERVRLGHLGEATITGPVVIDLVHMLAELIENALRFSPPDSTVELDGRPLQGGYQLAVVDHGVGMADVELIAANQRLAGQVEADGMPTRYLGQYVVAKLASKTAAMVRLQPTVGGRGVTAVVSLPASAIVGDTDRSAIARPLPGSRAARDQGPDLYAPGAGLGVPPEQPDAVIDPAADPYAEPVPVTDDLVPAVHPASEDWGWTPELSDAAPASVEATSFVAEDLAAGIFASGAFGAAPIGAAAPPPVPEWVPEQTWIDAAVVAPASDLAAGPVAESPSPAPAVEPVGSGWLGSTGAPDADVAPRAEDVGDDDAAGDAAPAEPAGSGIGGLTRRVPGASLHDSPLASASTPGAVAADRSADGVRSMLSAFQTGRSRGRDGTTEHADADPPGPGTDEDRSWSTPVEIAIDERPGVSRAPELEEPRDH